MCALGVGGPDDVLKWQSMLRELALCMQEHRIEFSVALSEQLVFAAPSTFAKTGFELSLLLRTAHCIIATARFDPEGIDESRARVTTTACAAKTRPQPITAQ